VSGGRLHVVESIPLATISLATGDGTPKESSLLQRQSLSEAGPFPSRIETIVSTSGTIRRTDEWMDEIGPSEPA